MENLPKEKELIDYEINAKRAAKDRELSDWGCGLFLAILFFAFIFIVLSIM